MTTTYLDDLRSSLAYIESKIRESKPDSDERESYESMRAHYIASIEAELEWLKNGGYSNKELHYRARFTNLGRIISHANQRNRVAAVAHSYWKRHDRKAARRRRGDELLEAIKEWHHGSEEDHDDQVSDTEHHVNDYNDHIDDMWEEHLGQPALIPPQPTRQEMENQAWAIYERCPLLRRKKAHGLSR